MNKPQAVKFIECIGGSRGRCWRAPPRVQILSFWHTNFLKCSHIGSCTPLRGRRPPYGKSWIRHWNDSIFDISERLSIVAKPKDWTWVKTDQALWGMTHGTQYWWLVNKSWPFSLTVISYKASAGVGAKTYPLPILTLL